MLQHRVCCSIQAPKQHTPHTQFIHHMSCKQRRRSNHFFFLAESERNLPRSLRLPRSSPPSPDAVRVMGGGGGRMPVSPGEGVYMSAFLGLSACSPVHNTGMGTGTGTGTRAHADTPPGGGAGGGGMSPRLTPCNITQVYQVRCCARIRPSEILPRHALLTCGKFDAAR